MIRFNSSTFVGNELKYIQEAMASDHLSGDGIFTAKCNAIFESTLNVKKSFMTTSCTHALEMSALLLDIKPGDEVIVPSFTFVSTINAFVLRGAVPVFIDIRKDTLNINENLIEAKITTRTKAIIVVHYAGVACEMSKIMEISENYGVPIIEDNAHGLFGKYKGQYLGTFGSFSTQSFHETKNFSCGEGGALLVNDDKYIERAEIIREKGTNRSNFFRGQVDKYSWVDIGSSYLLSEVLAGFLYAQLEERLKIQGRRKEIWDKYNFGLKSWSEENGIRLPYIPEYCAQSYHMYYLIFPSLESRTKFISYLKGKNISAIFHYLPLHNSQMGLKFKDKKPICPITESISDTIVRLPFFYSLDNATVDKIIQAVVDS